MQKMIHFWRDLSLGCPSMSTPAKWGLCGRRPRARIVFLDLILAASKGAYWQENRFKDARSQKYHQAIPHARPLCKGRRILIKHYIYCVFMARSSTIFRGNVSLLLAPGMVTKQDFQTCDTTWRSSMIGGWSCLSSREHWPFCAVQKIEFAAGKRRHVAVPTSRCARTVGCRYANIARRRWWKHLIPRCLGKRWPMIWWSIMRQVSCTSARWHWWN